MRMVYHGANLAETNHGMVCLRQFKQIGNNTMVSWWFVGLVAGILFTPGPTNTLLATAGLQRGWWQATRLIPFELVGYVLAISVWGYGMAQMMAHLPQLPAIMKTLSAVYLAFLAMRLWQHAQASDSESTGRIAAPNLFLATLLNPKALLFATAVFPMETWRSWQDYFTIMAEFGLLVGMAACAWIALGASMRQAKQTWLRPEYLQRLAACVLSVFAFGLLGSIWSI